MQNGGTFDAMPRQGQNATFTRQHQQTSRMDGEGQEDRPRTSLLDTEVCSNAGGQTIVGDGTDVSQITLACCKPRQNWVETFY